MFENKRQEKIKPRIGVVALAYPGYSLGEDMCGGKYREMLALLQKEDVEAVSLPFHVLSESDAGKAGEKMKMHGVDCILAVMTTFVPDYFIVRLLDKCDIPIFLWAVERELCCISVVCGPLITATLYELKKHYRLAAADIGDAETLARLMVFARASMLLRTLREMRVGYVGGKNNIMFSMTADGFALKNGLQVTPVTLAVEEFYNRADQIKDADAEKFWKKVKKHAGSIRASDADGVLSSRYYLACEKLCADYDLTALSINCFPHLKSKICLAVALMNDSGIAAACEGDLYSTVLMSMLQSLSGKAAFNGDFLRMYPEENAVMFSHCGAGAFSLAASPEEICLQASIETNDGLAVCYPSGAEGTVTLVNLMGGRESLRITAMRGDARKTCIEYEGNPLRVRFDVPVKEILQRIAVTGAGHHWNGIQQNIMEELSLLCEFRNIKFNQLT